MIKVLCNGCFDVLTPRHREMLKWAKSLGDRLYVAIDSDRRVAEKKGDTRPIFTQRERADHLNDLKYVDSVFLFDNDKQLEDTITLVQPKYLVIGIEYKDKHIVGAELVEKVMFFEPERITSSTEIINKLDLKKDDNENEQWRYM